MNGFNRLDASERRTLIGGAVFLLLVLGYFFLWEPFTLKRDILHKKISTQAALYESLQQNAAQIRQLRQNQTKPPIGNEGKSLFSLLDSSLDNNPLRKAGMRMEPENERQVRVYFKQVDFNRLLIWLAGLRREHSIVAGKLQAETLSNDQGVKVSLVLQRPVGKWE